MYPKTSTGNTRPIAASDSSVAQTRRYQSHLPVDQKHTNLSKNLTYHIPRSNFPVSQNYLILSHNSSCYFPRSTSPVPKSHLVENTPPCPQQAIWRCYMWLHIGEGSDVHSDQQKITGKLMIRSAFLVFKKTILAGVILVYHFGRNLKSV